MRDTDQIRSFLQILGERLPSLSRLYLVGGGALVLLGSPRLTIDIDFLGDDLHPTELQRIFLKQAEELEVYMEAVPLEKFIPIPEGSGSRIIHIGNFDNLEAFIADPYSIALSKVARGFDTDLDDIIFLLQNKFISMNELVLYVEKALESTRDYDMDKAEVEVPLLELKKRL